MVAIVPGGKNVIQLKSWSPSNTWKDETFGCTLGVLSMFTKSGHCLINLLHRVVGKLSSQEHKPAIK